MSSKLCSELQTAMRGEYGLHAATPFLGFHILYMGAVQDVAFHKQYHATSDVELRAICVRLFFAFPFCLAEPLRQIAEEEYITACKGVPFGDEEAWNTDNTARCALAERRLGMLRLIKPKAARLFASLRQHPDFPSLATIQKIPASELARVWADFFDLDKVLEEADARGGTLPPSYTAQYVEETAKQAEWLSICVRDFVRAGDKSESPARTDTEKRKWWPSFFNQGPGSVSVP